MNERKKEGKNRVSLLGGTKKEGREVGGNKGRGEMDLIVS